MSVQKLFAKFVILGLAFSMWGCRTAPPRQELCFVNIPSMVPADWYVECFDTEDDSKERVLAVSDLDKYICRSPEDEQILEEWIKRMLQKQDRSGFVEKQRLPIDRFMERMSSHAN